MKRTLFAAAAVVAAGLAAVYLTGADGTNASQAGTAGTHTQTPMTDAQQVMQAPALETVECSEGYILLMPCPICHTCPVCQANCGTAHALKCCLGNKTPAYNASNGTTSGGQASGAPMKQHIQTSRAEAVKHAAGRPATTPQPQMDTATMSVIQIESN
jgi:hypothetical protein